METFEGDLSKIKNKLSYAVDAVEKCYMGKSLVMQKHSLVCKGFIRPWLKKRPFLQNAFQIQKENLDNLRKTINKRLDPRIIEKTRLNTNTNFFEGFNRSLRRSLPSNVTFKKNVSGRAHAAAHSVNYGPGESILELCSALHCAIPVHSSSHMALKNIQKVDILQKQHKKNCGLQTI